MSGYLKQINYQTPAKGDDTAFTRAYNKPLGTSFWGILSSTPHVPACMTCMASYNEGHKDELEFYTIEERLAKGADSDTNAVMMVDVGSGHGQPAINLKNQFPHLPGKLIVQGLPHAFPEGKDGMHDIEYMPHDFMTDQPIKCCLFC